MAFPAIIAAVASLFEPATKILENLHISEADRLKLQNELAKIQADTQAKFIQLEQDKLDLQKVEIGSNNVFVQSWRPACSIVMVVIILAASFGWAHPTAQFYEIAQWFLVGYGVSRSAFDKGGIVSAAKTVVDTIKKK